MPSCLLIYPVETVFTVIMRSREIITHQLPLEEANKAYEIFGGREDNCIKVILKP